MLAHEVLDLVSDEEHHGGDSAAPPAREATDDSPPLPPSSPRRKRRKLALVEPDASNTDDALSVISLSDTEASTSPRIPPSSEGELSEAEASLTTSAITSLNALTPSTAFSHSPSSSSSTSKKRKKRAVVRYFGSGDELLHVKCRNCGSGGHEAWDCPQELEHAPCYICGQSSVDHVKGEGCPNELCWHCGGAGHQRAVSAHTATTQEQHQRLRRPPVDDSKFEIQATLCAALRTAYQRLRRRLLLLPPAVLCMRSLTSSSLCGLHVLRTVAMRASSRECATAAAARVTSTLSVRPLRRLVTGRCRPSTATCAALPAT